MTPAKNKKGWKEIPLIARVGIVIGSGVLLYQLRKKGKRPNKKVCNLVSLDQGAREDLQIVASELFNSMNGLNFPIMGQTDRSDSWDAVRKWGANKNGLCYLHNYWLDNIDKDSSVFEWINSQTVIPYTLEEQNKLSAIAALQNAGLGQ